MRNLKKSSKARDALLIHLIYLLQLKIIEVILLKYKNIREKPLIKIFDTSKYKVKKSIIS